MDTKNMPNAAVTGASITVPVCSKKAAEKSHVTASAIRLGLCNTADVSQRSHTLCASTLASKNLAKNS